MSQHLAGGWLLISPDDAPAVADLFAAGARSRGLIRAQVGPLSDVLEAASRASHACARSEVGLPPGPTLAVGEPSAADVVDVQEAARVLGTSERQVRRLLAAGRLAGRRIGWAWVVDVDSLAALARTRGTVA